MVVWGRSMVVFPDSCPCWRHADLLSIALSGLYIAYYIIVIMSMISYPSDLYVPGKSWLLSPVLRIGKLIPTSPRLSIPMQISPS
jgi:hypothetical protein